ncbi:MAG: T9SS type A sorting domain-containing protein [Flavobacteriales bacterium]|nr:T9SS type A sorting domain-containing protein [Flavobacteriales bacterium]
MRSIAILIALLLPLMACSQELTVAEVYDYQPGDVFQVRYSLNGVGGGPGGPPSFGTDSIQQRFYSIGGDTLFYQVWRTLYRPPLAPGFDPTFLQELDTLMYTDLEGPATHHSLPNPCLEPQDSIGYADDHCGLETWVSWTNEDEGCFEPDSWISELIRGCGGPYYWSFEAAGPFLEERKLVYFQKGEVTCGDLITAVQERATSAYRLYPNPSSGQVFVDGGNGGQYRVMDLSGRMRRLGRAVQGPLDLADLEPGQYLFSVQDIKGRWQTLPLTLE